MDRYTDQRRERDSETIDKRGMIEEAQNESLNVGLKINMNKLKQCWIISCKDEK